MIVLRSYSARRLWKIGNPVTSRGKMASSCSRQVCMRGVSVALCLNFARHLSGEVIAMKFLELNQENRSWTGRYPQSFGEKLLGIGFYMCYRV